MLGISVLIFIVLMAVLAPKYGVDSREGSQDPRGPLHPVGLG